MRKPPDTSVRDFLAEILDLTRPGDDLRRNAIE